MVFLNLATQQMTVKIVYYGPGLCGKTTNLQQIYQKTSPETRGEMVSLETEADRTLFFDLLPLEVGMIGGYRTKIQLYTVPGQVFYNTTRKLVLKGVDGIVFVADSQRAMADANQESLNNLRGNLMELGLRLEDIPMILQLNKRDLPNVMNVAELNGLLNVGRDYPIVEAIAVQGKGVFETLKEVSKATLKHLRKKLTEEHAVRKTGVVQSKFSIRPEPTPAPASPAGAPPPPAAVTGALRRDSRPMAGRRPTPEEKIEFGTVAQTNSQATMEVRHVRVKSSIDVLEELEKLRRQAPLISETPKAKRKSNLRDVEDLLLMTMDQRKEISKTFELAIKRDTLGRAAEVVLALVVRDSAQKGLEESKMLVIPLRDIKFIRQLLLNLKIDLQVL